jgi:hypothetical protein
MRPPRCYVCHRDHQNFPDDGQDYFTLIYFGATEDAKMGPSRVLAELERSGHPSNAVWFCRDHTAVAREYEDFSRDEGLAAILKRCSGNPGG